MQLAGRGLEVGGERALVVVAAEMMMGVGKKRVRRLWMEEWKGKGGVLGVAAAWFGVEWWRGGLREGIVRNSR